MRRNERRVAWAEGRASRKGMAEGEGQEIVGIAGCILDQCGLFSAQLMNSSNCFPLISAAIFSLVLGLRNIW
ncbi:hypothetical protein D3C85_825270 [compost metagenome]